MVLKRGSEFCREEPGLSMSVVVTEATVARGARIRQFADTTLGHYLLLEPPR